MDTKQLQEEIRAIGRQLDWSHDDMAEIIYVDRSDSEGPEDYDELRRFQEKFRKSLQRDTTNPGLLEGYLDCLVRHPRAKDINKVFNKHVPSDLVSPAIEKEMREISRNLDDAL